MRDKEFKKLLIRRYRNNEASDSEVEAFFQLVKEGSLDIELEELNTEEGIHDESPLFTIPVYKTHWFQIAVAAVLILIISGAYFLSTHPEGQKQLTRHKQTINDVSPGGNKALLTLADGSKIVLDTAVNGSLVKQGNTKVVKLNGQLAYTSSGAPSEMLYNIISTPKSGQYQLILSDGTKVWLNSSSSLRFPTSFIGNERKVELSGEGYFEVVKNSKMPFRVELSNGMKVEVLGTHFNLMSYNDEEIVKTTLIEGKVKVSKGIDYVMLAPNQQARLLKSNNDLSIDKSVDVNRVVAWKNGLFDFYNDNLSEIMKQLSRWYDVEIIYSSPINEQHFTGSIRREVNISQVLQMLKLAGGVDFTIDGKNIIVKSQ